MTTEARVAGDSARRRKRGRFVVAVAILLLLISEVGWFFLKAHAEPILRARVIETLTARFQTKVEMGDFHVSVEDGLAVSGEGLKIYGKTDPNIHEPGVQPLIGIEEFRFQTGLLALLRTPMHVHSVRLKGLVLNIPPAGERREMQSMGSEKSKIKIVVDEFVSQDAELVINTNREDKLPLEFSIEDLKMQDVGPGQPMHFDAKLLNPKPIGSISSKGLFGPLQMDRPRDTPVKGTYTFSNADLATIKGIAGILSSTGQYSGSLGSIVVDGKTETPDFRLTVSDHPVPLNTEFHAIVDGTSGNTYLQPVNARVLHSSFVAKGSVVRMKPQGHEIALDVTIDHARIEDLLTMCIRTEPAIMSGAVQAKAKLDLKPGAEDVSNRLRLAGNFEVTGAHFSNEKIQKRIDDLSLRSQGRPKLVQSDATNVVQSDMSGVFDLKQEIMSFSQLHFEVPGTNVDMTGQYGLDGNTFDFRGKVRLDAELSHMVTGWKSVLLKPVDPFFKKNGAGTEVPIKISGTKAEPHIGLDFGHKSDGKY
ncbi:MAG: AsmA-like C-terminal region-containing protein [Terriglobales bacterium]